MANKPRDITGQKFGRLTAIKILPERKNGKTVWQCLCECGNKKDITATQLHNKSIKSCGCLRREMSLARIKNVSTIKSLKGQRFGKLTVIRMLNKRKKGSVVWECICDCGNIKNVTTRNLKTGDTKSCGCFKREHETTLYKNNTTGVRGVCLRSDHKKYQATITFKKKTYHLGTYETLKDATKARKNAEEKIRGSFIEWYNENYPKKKKGQTHDAN